MKVLQFNQMCWQLQCMRVPQVLKSTLDPDMEASALGCLTDAWHAQSEKESAVMLFKVALE